MRYLVKRVLTYLGVFFAVLNLIFFLPRFAPGSAADILAGNTRLPTLASMEISQRLGLNHPLYYQYTTFLKNVLLTFPPYLGVSYSYFPVSVSYLFAVRAGWSFALILTSLAVGTLLAYAAGILVSPRRGGKIESALIYSVIMFNSVPLFWVSMVMLYAFAIYTHIFPLYGNVSPQAIPGTLDYVESVLWHMVLPVLALSLSLLGESFLILRGSMQEVLKADYVMSAKSRGLTNWMISSGYVVRNSLLPLVSVVSFSTASMLSRLILIEAVFAYPGIGDLLVDGIIGRDYPVVTGSLFYLALIVIAGGLIGDLLLLRLDPRLRGR